MLALSEPLVLIPDPLADGLLAMPANPMDLGSGSSVSKKDAKLGFVVNYTNLLLIPGPVFTQASRVDVLRGFHNRTWDQLTESRGL